MGFRGVLLPRETGRARAVPEPRDAEEQLHPVPAEGGCLPQPTPRMPAASPGGDLSWGPLFCTESSFFSTLVEKSCPLAGAWWEKCNCLGGGKIW